MVENKRGFAAMSEEQREEISRKDGEARKEELGPEGYRELGHKGGEVVKETRGSEFFREIGRKGGESRGRDIEE